MQAHFFSWTKWNYPIKSFDITANESHYIVIKGTESKLIIENMHVYDFFAIFL